MRITKALIRYNKALCDVDLSDCAPSAQSQKRLTELALIKSYLEAAKAKVEFCHEPQKGMTLYNYALRLLNKLDCKNC